MLNSLRLLKYVTSFSDGRVRIRHPALRREAVAATAREKLAAIDGVLSVDFNTVSVATKHTFLPTKSSGA